MYETKNSFFFIILSFAVNLNFYYCREGRVYFFKQPHDLQSKY